MFAILLSPPRENVLFVPDRNVLLTGSRWGVGRTGSSDDDAAGSRPAGSAEKSAEEADYAKQAAAELQLTER